jgi:hypothetical protein
MRWMGGILFLLSCSTARLSRSKYCAAPTEYASKSVAQIVSESRKTVSEGKEKRALVFGLFGSKKLYTEGLMRNLGTAKDMYPNWDVVVYMDSATVPQEIIDRARAAGAVVKLSPEYHHASARFYAADLAEYDRFVVRDVDSRLMLREVAAVADWIQQDWAIVHGMRDAPAQSDPLQAGMWGARSKLLRQKLLAKKGKSSMEELYKDFIGDQKEVYGDDQRFLKDIILPSVGEEAFLSHESLECNAFKHSRGFPIIRSPSSASIGYGFRELDK